MAGTGNEQPIDPNATAGFMERRRAASIATMASLEAPPKTDPAPAPGSEAPPAEEKPPVEPKPDPKPDPAPDDPALAAIRKQELHLRRQLAEERAQWQAEREREMAPLRQQLTEFEQWKKQQASAKDDPISYLKAAGYTEADFDQLARQVYAESPEGRKDPKNRVAALQTRAQQEAIAEAKAAREEAAAVRKLLEERDQQAQAEAHRQRYLSTVAKAVSDETPIARAALARNPERTQQRLYEIADRLYTESSPYEDLREVPAPAAVLKAYEAEFTEIEELIRAARPQPVQPAETQPKPSTTLTPGGSAPTQVQRSGRKSREELIADLQRMEQIAKT